MKKILLTGIAGFIGSHTLEHILENTDWEVIGIDSLEHRGNMARINQVLSKDESWSSRLSFTVHDLAKGSAQDIIDIAGPVDVVINMASESHVDRSIDDPKPFIQNNVMLAINMLEYARITKPQMYIQISTDEIYGPADDHSFVEWERYLPSNPYSASKASQEMISISYWRTYGVPLVITNTTNNFGQMQDSEKYIPMVIKRVLEGETVDVHVHGNEIGSRYYMHARNHADALNYIIENTTPTKYGESDYPDKYHVTTDDCLDNLEIAQTIANIIGEPLNYNLTEFHATRPGHDMHYGLNMSKLKAMGWNPPVRFRDSITETVNDYLEHREWL